jgi:hypothetical protein
MTGLRVLLTEDEPHAGDDAERALRAAGHEVVRCFDPDGRGFPCRGIADINACPLRNQTVDITLATRTSRRALPARAEDGVLCSIRHHVPVVVTGDLVFDPFEPWEASAVESGADVVDACERAARQPLRRHTEIALAAVHDWMQRRAESRTTEAVAVDVRAALVAVRRIDGLLEVEVRAPDLPASDRDMLAVRILAALRAFDRDARGIDVSFVETA